MKNLIEKIERNLNRLSMMHKQSGRSYLSLMCFILRLKRHRGFIFTEMHDNELDLHGDSYIESFLGWKEQKKLLSILNPRKYFSLARNKYLTHVYFESQGLSDCMAPLYCYYNPSMTARHNPRQSHDLQSTIEVIKNSNIESFIIKTTESSHGDNVFVVNTLEYIPDDVVLTLFNGDKINLSQILKSEPLIFEGLIRQTEQISQFNPSSVNTVRFMTTLWPDGSARIIATFIKIGREGSCVDNAGGGGNVDANIDTETGELCRAIRFDGWRHITSIDSHPDTGAQLNGVIVQNWNAIKEKVKTYQQAIPFVKAAGWDIAITDNGPIIVEVNDMWDRTGQLFVGKGWRKEILDCYLAWKKHH